VQRTQLFLKPTETTPESEANAEKSSLRTAESALGKATLQGGTQLRKCYMKKMKNVL